MKRIYRMLPMVALAACGMLTACSNENSDAPMGGETMKAEAFMRVNIVDAGGFTRAGEVSSTGYELGETTEHDVKTAHFYFYDADGVYVAQATVWNGGEAVTETGNVEYMGKNVIALKGLTGKNFPRYMATVLNAPTDFVPATYLSDLGEQLSTLGETTDGGFKNGESFIMSTTSFLPTADQTGYDRQYPYVNKIQESDFVSDPTAAESLTPVNVYVERLAAKLRLQTGSELTSETEHANTYKLKMSVAGMTNDNTTDVEIGAEDTYIQFTGWGLTATAKKSYMMKRIDNSESEGWNSTDWASDWLESVWNKSSDYRSFWGKGYAYGIELADGKNPNLNYINFNDLKSELGFASTGNVAYTAENTTTAERAGETANLTTILVGATLLDKEFKALACVHYNNMMFREADYKQYVANSVNKGENQAWTKKANSDTEYEQIGNLIEFENLGNGYVACVLPKIEGAESQDKLYKLTVAEDGTKTATALSVEEYNKLSEDLKAFNSGEGKEKAMHYKDGKMYYTIPVRHLNNKAIEDTQVAEGYFGVVRNHLYDITINSLKNLGHGVADETEAIVPEENPYSEKWQLGAKINILSWKIVSQTVDL